MIKDPKAIKLLQNQELDFYKLQVERLQKRVAKIINKAIDNGYKFPFDMEALKKVEMIFGEFRWLPYVFFSHEFAKAYWGENPSGEVVTSAIVNFDIGNKDTKNGFWKKSLTLKAWQIHLQQMVLEEDYITYLEKFL